MSDSCPGAVLVIRNIENECFALGATTGVKLSYNAGVALSDISNSDKMNVEQISTMKRHLPDDDVVEMIETKKVKLEEDKKGDTPVGVVNGNCCLEDNQVKKINYTKEGSTNGIGNPLDELVKSNSDVNEENNTQICKDNNGNGEINFKEVPTLENNAVNEASNKTDEIGRAISVNELIETDSKENGDKNCDASLENNLNAENNLVEAPTLESEVSDNVSNIDKEIDLCDKSNSNNVDIKSCAHKTATIDIIDEKSTNSPKTEIANANLDSNVEIDSISKSPINDVSNKDAQSSDLIKNSINTEPSSYAASSNKVDIELGDRVDSLNSHVEESLVDDSQKGKTKQNDIDNLNNLVDKSDSESKCDENEYLEPQENMNESIELEDKDSTNLSDNTLDPLDVSIKEEPIEEEETELNFYEENPPSDHQPVVNCDYNIIPNRSNVNETSASTIHDTSNDVAVSVAGTNDLIVKGVKEVTLDAAVDSKPTSCREEITNKVSDEPAAKKLKLDVHGDNVLEISSAQENTGINEDLHAPKQNLVETETSSPKTNEKYDDIEVNSKLFKTIKTETETKSSITNGLREKIEVSNSVNKKELTAAATKTECSSLHVLKGNYETSNSGNEDVATETESSCTADLREPTDIISIIPAEAKTECSNLTDIRKKSEPCNSSNKEKGKSNSTENLKEKSESNCSSVKEKFIETLTESNIKVGLGEKPEISHSSVRVEDVSAVTKTESSSLDILIEKSEISNSSDKEKLIAIETQSISTIDLTEKSKIGNVFDKVLEVVTETKSSSTDDLKDKTEISNSSDKEKLVVSAIESSSGVVLREYLESSHSNDKEEFVAAVTKTDSSNIKVLTEKTEIIKSADKEEAIATKTESSCTDDLGAKNETTEEKGTEHETHELLGPGIVQLPVQCDENAHPKLDERAPHVQLDSKETSVNDVETLEPTPIDEDGKFVIKNKYNENIQTIDCINTGDSKVTEKSAGIEKEIDHPKISVDTEQEKLKQNEKDGSHKHAGIPDESNETDDDSKASGTNDNELLQETNVESNKSEVQPKEKVETKERDISLINIENNVDSNKTEEKTKERAVRDDHILVDSDIEIVDDLDTRVHQSKNKEYDDKIKRNEENTDTSENQIMKENKKTVDPIDEEEGKLMIDEKEQDSDVELLGEESLEKDKNKEGNQNETPPITDQTIPAHTDITVMEVDEAPTKVVDGSEKPINETEKSLESESKISSLLKIDNPTFDLHQKNEVNAENKNEDVSKSKIDDDNDDDEIIFIKECKKASDCTCVMCYKNKSPDKMDNVEKVSENKSKTSGKNKKDQTKKNVDDSKSENKDIGRTLKVTEKFDRLSRKGLEKVVTQMFVTAFGYQSELGVLRELLWQAQSENKTVKALCASQGKQLKELMLVHEKALGEIRAFRDEPGREGSLQPLKITRNVGLQVNVVTPSEKKRLVSQSPAAKSPSLPVTRSAAVASGVNKLKRPLLRTPTPPPLSRPRSSPAVVSPAGNPGAVPRRANPSPTPRAGRPPNRTVPGPGGLRILAPRALNSTVTSAVRSPAVSPRQSPVGRVVPRSPSTPTTQGATHGLVSSNKTSGGSVDIIDLDDDETVQSTTKNITKIIRSPPNAVLRTPTNTSIRIANPTNTGVISGKGATPPQRVYVPLSQGYKIRASTNTSTSIPSLTPTTTYVLNTAAGLIPFQTNNVRLNIRPNANASPVRINYQGLPAPVPATPKLANLPTEAMYKVVPGAPKLRVQLAQEGKGIQLTWSLDTPADMATIESYQLYAYQENKAVPINCNLWKNIGKLDALPLPMACTLTQFTSGHTYHFLVRAVDVFKRYSAFSNPGTIHLRS